MSPLYATPGVYIEEITGPGVIGGVGTSTAAFIGPAARGPFVPKTITTFDEFKRIYGREADEWPYLFANRWYYLGLAVQGFFENGGVRAVILRVGTAKAARWTLKNKATEDVLQLEARQEGSGGNGLSIVVTETGLTGAGAREFAYATATFTVVNGTTIKVAYPVADSPRFVQGDTVLLTHGNDKSRNVITSITVDANQKASIVVEDTLALQAGTTGTITIANIKSPQARFRLKLPLLSLQPGSLIKVSTSSSPAGDHHAIVDATDDKGFVYLRQPLFQPATGSWSAEIPLRSGSGAAEVAAKVETIDFSLKIMRGAETVEEANGLSLDPFHAGYVHNVGLKSVRVLALVPASETPSPPLRNLAMATALPPAQTVTGDNDDPSRLLPEDYKDALTALEDVDEVSLVCIPDSANELLIQQAAIDHCIRMKDRIAVLDVPFGREPDGPVSARSHRASVEAKSGFAALYYPWLHVPQPVDPALSRPAVRRPLPIPPSGHIAGIMARTDVHQAPANTDVRGVMGLERVLSDRQQALINLEGVNALRSFRGEGVIVWGARTTAPKTETDWTYVNVRRLMLYIEESIEEGIRWAVFKPNDRPLWQSLKRTIDDFLEGVWKHGGLAGAKREQAYQVRIDEGLNPQSEIVLGRLHIEIKVAPVRPAEFIIVRIGLWDGGAVITES